MKMRVLLILSALTLPAVASAQSLELFALTGVVQLWDDEGSLGSGVPVGGGVGFRSPHGWGVEAQVEGQKAARHFESDVRFDSTVTAGRARILKYFGRGATQLYAGGGAGATRIRSTYDYPAGCGFGSNTQFQCTSRDVHERTSTSGTISCIFGVRIAAAPHLFVRPEFEVSRAGEHTRIGGTVAVGGSW
jgi:hypothetical protein